MSHKKNLLYLILLLLYSCSENNHQPDSPATTTSRELELKQAHAKYPDSLQLAEQLIEFYRNNGNYDSAIRVTDRLLMKDSTLTELWHIKATLHYENEDTVNAIRALKTAITIFPLPDYIIALGTIYAYQKNPRALFLADELISSNNHKPLKDAIFIKGLYYNSTGNKKMAIALFDSCTRLDYTFMLAYREKAIALYDTGNYEDALKVLTRAVTIQNNFDEGYYWMGKCYQKLGKKQAAIKSYQMALLYDKNFIEARDSLKALGFNSQ